MMAGTSAAADSFEDRRQYAFERAAIDASTRLPVLAFFASAVFWLVIGSLLGLTASVKFHYPDFTLGTEYDTLGRVRPAHLNAVTYGWATPAGIGVLIWLMARLARAELVYPRLLLVSAAVWNVGVALGIVGILAGQSTSIEWLEFPPYVPPILASSLAMVTAWAVATFRVRHDRHVYVTQWYLFGAVFWFPWVYTATTLLTIYRPAQGVVQAAANWWFAHNVLGLWLTPIGVGAAYYLIPKVIGRPIHSYYLSIIGFWSLALFYSWAGTHHLIGGPLPAWFLTAGIVASIMMFLPVGAVALNHHFTMVGYFNLLRYSPTLRFVVFGAIAYTVVSVQGSLEALRQVNEITHFTHYTVGHAHLGLYGFYSMIMFGSMYYIVPRLTSWEWYSGRLIAAHFWLSVLGIALYVMALSIGGWFQGLDSINRTNPPAFVAIVRRTIPFLQLRSIGGSMMVLGHFVFALLFVLNLIAFGKPRTGPTLFAERVPRARPAGESVAPVAP